MAKKFKKQKIEPDNTYNDILVSRFINQVMRRGKKSLAQKIVYRSFDIIKKQTNKDPLDVFKDSLEAAAPNIEVRPRRVGGATYQVPREVKGERRISLAMRWIIGAARGKKGKAMEERLAQEIILASKGEGEVIRKKANVHKMAEANRAFAYLSR